ncbi:MAG: alpha/beta hydrolase fold, partial [Phenylobacterium sp.]|nr:alpha/beta hydrolase fold [Phenylobacterium sp.]
MVVDALPFYALVILGPQATVDRVRPMAAMMRDSSKTMADDAYRALMKPQLARMAVSDASRATILDWSMASDRGVVGRALYDDLTLDLRPGLADIHTPITLLYPDDVPVGAHAGAVDPLYQAAFAPAKTIALKRIDASAHFIMLDQPQAFAEALDAFLAQP